MATATSVHPPSETRVRMAGTHLAAAHDTLVLVVAKGALVTYPHKGGRSYVAVTDRTFAIAFVAKTADGDAWLFPAHDQVPVSTRVSTEPIPPVDRENLRMMTRHDDSTTCMRLISRAPLLRTLGRAEASFVSSFCDDD